MVQGDGEGLARPPCLAKELLTGDRRGRLFLCEDMATGSMVQCMLVTLIGLRDYRIKEDVCTELILSFSEAFISVYLLFPIKCESVHIISNLH